MGTTIFQRPGESHQLLWRAYGLAKCIYHISRGHFDHFWDEFYPTLPGVSGSPSEYFPHIIPLVLPCFHLMKARVVTLESRIPQLTLEGPPDTELSVKDALTVDSVLSCLDIAESIAKMLPVVGNLVEGACGTVRKIIAAAKVCVLFNFARQNHC